MDIITTAFEKHNKIPLYMQLFNKIKQDIMAGYLKKGERLPSIRQGMKLFSLSKTSVENAYAKLISDGFVVSMPNKGYFIDVDQEAVQKRQFILQPQIDETTKIKYDMTSNAIDGASFDVPLWKRYIKEVMEDKTSLATYGDVQGELPLRRALQKYAYTQRGVICNEEHIIVGANYQSLLYLLLSLLPNHQRIAMEEDSFAQAKQVFLDMHKEVKLLPRIQEGISMTSLQKSVATLLYVQSSACGLLRKQIGKKRNELLSWCDEEHYLIEDDHNGELRYHSKALPALQGFDSKQCVIYLGSFSKTLLPSLRIAYMILPPSLYERYQAKKEHYSPSASKMEQLALARYIGEGNLERHIKKVKKLYERKSKYMEMLIQRYFPHHFYYLDEASCQYVVEFSEGLLNNIDKALLKEKILIEVTHKTLRISFSSLPEEKMEKVIQLIHGYVDKEKERSL